ncbi:C-type lectin domain family 2 member D-like [Paroedura picta]|uniref:C-type lectin domain family 2 member D-like n=1 Tax=Paroedura picta TaxID=143630 RepID=UPI00405677A1
MRKGPSCPGFCLWTAMIEERSLPVERSSHSKASETQIDPACENLQEDIETIKISERIKRGSFQNCFCRSSREAISNVLNIIFLLIILSLIGFLVRSPEKEAQQQCCVMDVPSPCGPACPSGWIGYGGKCYFFSEEGRNWTSGQSFCVSYNSSLAVIEDEQEKAFVMRFKCSSDHWIGLRKGPDRQWKWADGTGLSGTLDVQEGGGDCAFLHSGSAVPSRCYIPRNWICSHHDAYASHKNSSIK